MTDEKCLYTLPTFYRIQAMGSSVTVELYATIRCKSI